MPLKFTPKNNNSNYVPVLKSALKPKIMFQKKGADGVNTYPGDGNFRLKMKALQAKIT